MNSRILQRISNGRKFFWSRMIRCQYMGGRGEGDTTPPAITLAPPFDN